MSDKAIIWAVMISVAAGVITTIVMKKINPGVPVGGVN